jgi:cytochrome c-type biogenesis protein CcmH/NrfG
MLGREGHVDEAQHELETSLASDPQFVDAHLLLGDLLVARRRPRDAVPHYRNAVRIAPDSARAHLGLASALIAAGEPAEAIEHLTAAAASPDPAIRSRARELLRAVRGR